MAQKIAVYEAGKLDRHVKRGIALLLVRRQLFAWRDDHRGIERLADAPLCGLSEKPAPQPFYIPALLAPAELPECKTTGPLVNVRSANVCFANCLVRQEFYA